MPTLLAERLAAPVPPQPPRKRWTRGEISVLESTGLFEGTHYELVEGELINKMPKKRPHTITLVKALNGLRDIFGPDRVEPETPIDVSPADNPTSEPEPDLVVLNRPSDSIRGGNPTPADIALVVEICDSSLHHDLTVKADLYARAGMLEYWAFDVNVPRLVVHRSPVEGCYVDVVSYVPGEYIEPLAAPGKRFDVSAAFLGA